MRKDSLIGIKELYLSNPDLLESTVSEMLNKVSPLFVDQEGNVRHCLYLLLKQVFQVLDQKVITPFFPLLLASLKCGLTHISTMIQMDSLKITNLLIVHYPRLMKEVVNSLLPLYLPLIAMKTQHAQSMSISKNKKADFLGLYVAKLPVLNQLLEFMLLIGDTPLTGTQSNAPVISTSDGKVWPAGDLSSRSLNFYDFCLQSPFLLLVNPLNVGIDNSFSVSPLTSSEVSFQLTGVENKMTKVLLELWIEMVSDSLFSAHSIPDDACSLLATVIQLLCVLVKHVSPSNQLDAKFLSQFANHFVPYFPLFQKPGSNQRPPSNILMLNIYFSQLILSVASSPATGSSSVDTKLVARYLAVILPQAASTLSSADLVKCVNVVLDMIRCRGRSIQDSDIALTLYTSCYKLFLSCHHASSAKLAFLLFISHVTDQLILRRTTVYDDVGVFKEKFLFPCLCSLPELLIKVCTSFDHAKLVLQVLKTDLTCQVDDVVTTFHAYLPQLYGKRL